MKKSVLIMAFTISATITMAQTTHQITNSGNAYTPASITVNVGDTVEFMVGSSHPTREVSQSTYQANGTTQLSGGFDIPSGNGKVYIANANTYYYVCVFHVASDNMKGEILVNTIGIDENETEIAEAEVFPNPVGEVLNFSINTGAAPKSATIYDLSGKSVKTLDLTTGTGDVRSFNISALKSGSYILKIENADSVEEIKFVKE